LGAFTRLKKTPFPPFRGKKEEDLPAISSRRGKRLVNPLEEGGGSLAQREKKGLLVPCQKRKCTRQGGEKKGP